MLRISIPIFYLSCMGAAVCQHHDIFRAVYGSFLRPWYFCCRMKGPHRTLGFSNVANRAEPNRTALIWKYMNRTESNRVIRQRRDPTIRPAPIGKALSGTELHHENEQGAVQPYRVWFYGSNLLQPYDRIERNRGSSSFFTGIAEANHYCSPTSRSRSFVCFIIPGTRYILGISSTVAQSVGGFTLNDFLDKP